MPGKCLVSGLHECVWGGHAAASPAEHNVCERQSIVQ
jgi:hypothetical protein